MVDAPFHASRACAALFGTAPAQCSADHGLAWAHLARIYATNDALGRIEVEQAFALNPDSLSFLDAVGYPLDRERGPELA